ncbi:MAG: N-glycosylase/DNA lyase [Candidatus Omnitrophica bacterium]|jgi:N-glycosylase/DNA lyase|nr:N-glycosylase/DNA lyase [Candidatus Omnitrophota bacterium]
MAMPVDKEKLKVLKQTYDQKKKAIADRLNDFKRAGASCDRDIFGELCFCILTPQSKAVKCDEIIRKLKETKLLFEGDAKQISPHVKGARFYKNKTGYLVTAREHLSHGGRIRIKDKIDSKDPVSTREWLVKNIKGIGYKEASHFLRNIGLGEDLAILDVHILRNLKAMGVISEIPKSLTKKRYLEIEEKLRRFSKDCGIPAGHLDILFWSMATGRIFK